jgi:hypothetical protein
MVPLAGIEPALLAELDFESSASTNSATGASAADNTGAKGAVNAPFRVAMRICQVEVCFTATRPARRSVLGQ